MLHKSVCKSVYSINKIALTIRHRTHGKMCTTLDSLFPFKRTGWRERCECKMHKCNDEQHTITPLHLYSMLRCTDTSYSLWDGIAETERSGFYFYVNKNDIIFNFSVIYTKLIQNWRKCN